jgi:DNA-directed RNA polymerase sigma subunit (sigma70/sigma32)
MPRPPRPDQVDRYVAMTLKQIADKLGCTPQAVRHVERRALEKIRAAMIERKIVTREGRYDVHSTS